MRARIRFCRWFFVQQEDTECWRCSKMVFHILWVKEFTFFNYLFILFHRKRRTAHFIPACFLIGLSFVGNRPYVAVTLMTLALGMSGAQVVTTVQNAHDLAPNFAATIFAFINTFGSTSGYENENRNKNSSNRNSKVDDFIRIQRFIAPLIVAHFTQERVSTMSHF